MAQMSSAAINDLRDDQFAYIEPGGEKDESGRTVPRSLRHFPIHDAAHIRNALARAPQSPFGDKAMPKIKAAAKKFGIDVADDETRTAVAPFPQMFLRSYPLEDIRILSRAQGVEYADGRTVEAVVAVWDREAEIQDNQGHYLETIGRTAFDKALQEARPQGSRNVWRTGVFYNHGMTLYGTPSDRFSVPLGSPVDIRAETVGLVTVTRYNETSLAEEILEAIRSGDITGHSFTGRIIKSNPSLPPRGGYRRSATGALSTVHRLELGLKEYGPTPFPAYVDTAVVGVRSMWATVGWPADLSRTSDEGDADEGDADGEPPDSDTPEDEGAVTDEPPTEDGEHSSRDESESSRSLHQRIAAIRRVRPGLTRAEGESQ
jgi:HK97 family phage prohead protease